VLKQAIPLNDIQKIVFKFCSKISRSRRMIFHVKGRIAMNAKNQRKNVKVKGDISLAIDRPTTKLPPQIIVASKRRTHGERIFK
jgi:hypothetical protein